jgi:hypothetical protein
VTSTRLSRTPDQRVYSSGSYDAYSFANCYVSLGSPDSEDFAFAKCDAEGNFTFTNVPKGNMKVTVFDQWNDLLVDGLSTPVKVDGESIGTTAQPIEIAVTQWRTNLYGRIFIDTTSNGVPDKDADGNDLEPGLPLVPFNIRYRDGSYMGFNNTDLAGYAGFNEVFPFLNWLVVDTDSARYKQTGVHVVYDAGGPAGPLSPTPSSHRRRTSRPTCACLVRSTALALIAPPTRRSTRRAAMPDPPGASIRVGCRVKAGRDCSATTASSSSR